MKRRLRTRIHFNRVYMQRGDSRVWTAHNSRGCFQGDTIVLQHKGVTIGIARFKPNAPQPRAFIEVRGDVYEKAGIVVVDLEGCA